MDGDSASSSRRLTVTGEQVPITRMVGRRFDPVAMIHQAAATNDSVPLVIKATLRLADADGVPLDYLSGQAFAEAMQQVYQAVLHPMQHERIRRLDAIDDWRVRPELPRLICDAVLQPLLDTLRSERARLLHLCYQVQTRAGITLDRKLWWSLVAARHLQRANGVDRVPNAEPLLLEVNHLMVHSVLVVIDRRILPFRDATVGQGFQHWLERLLSAALGLLLEPTETQGPQVQFNSSGEFT